MRIYVPHADPRVNDDACTNDSGMGKEKTQSLPEKRDSDDALIPLIADYPCRIVATMLVIDARATRVIKHPF